MVADNDYAVGRVVEALSASPFWKSTAIFITEDDTQASGDHIDSHRTFLLTTGGLARHAPDGAAQGSASHQLGSFPSVLSTIEALLGVRPLTIYDSAAAPLDSVLTDDVKNPVAPPYKAVPSPSAFFIVNNARPPANAAGTPLARLSALMDWRRLDSANPYLLHDLLYSGIRGWPLPAQDLALLDKHR
jgi:hypothetical protein